MPYTLETEARRFERDKVKFKNIFTDTLKALKSINSDELNRKLLETLLPTEINAETFTFYEKKPSLIIFGNSNYAKAVVTNTILQRFVLPIHSDGTRVRWRLIKFEHGNSDRFRLVDTILSDGLSDTEENIYNTLDNQLLNESPADTSSLFINAELCGVPFLYEGLSCAVARNCTQESLSEVSLMYTMATHGVLPIFIYAFEEKEISSWNIIELTEMRRLASDISFFFVIVPGRTTLEAVPLISPAEKNPKVQYSHGSRKEDKDSKRKFKEGKQPISSIRNANENLRLTTVKKFKWKVQQSYSINPQFCEYVQSLLVQLGFISKMRENESKSDSSKFLDKLSMLEETSGTLSEPFTMANINLPFDPLNKGQPSELCINFVGDFSDCIANHVRCRFQTILTSTLKWLHVAVNRALHGLILQAYDINYELMATPKRLSFAREEEMHLYISLMQQTRNRRQQIQESIAKAIEQLRIELPTTAAVELDLCPLVHLDPSNKFAEGTLFIASGSFPSSVGSSNVDTVASFKDVFTQPEATSVDVCALSICEGHPSKNRDVVSRKQEQQIVNTGTSNSKGNWSLSSMFQRGVLWNSRSSLQETLMTSNKMDEKRVPSNRWCLAITALRNFILDRVNKVISDRVSECMQMAQNSSVGTLKRVVCDLDRLSTGELKLGPSTYARNTEVIASDFDLVDDDDEGNDGYESGVEVQEDGLDELSTDRYPRRTPSTVVSRRISEAAAVMEPVHFRQANLAQLLDLHAGCYRRNKTPSNTGCPVAGTGSSSADAQISEEGGQESHATAIKSLKFLLQFSYGLSIAYENPATSKSLRWLFRNIREIEDKLPWSKEKNFDADWVRRTTEDILQKLSYHRIANEIFNQLIERLQSSHALFTETLDRLQTRAQKWAGQFEESRNNIRRYHAPRMACLLMEIGSLRNQLEAGIPILGREVGRGQFGVVYACASWGSVRNLAVKSVAISDDKYKRELAMEIYYSGQLAQNERIVTTYGHVIDNRLGNKSSPIVYIMMERLSQDLYTGLRAGLEWLTRLRIALDVLEGIRFLHNEGLVHRDIKPRNVLLTNKNRAKLTDLGFCKPHSMINGSVLGTPMHMAPEILDRNYSTSVDVYAFGILFWYICAGKIKLPQNYEKFTDKSELWSGVKKGLRPEKLHYFKPACWDLMRSCWTSDDAKRPHVGLVYETLSRIYIHERELRKKEIPETI